MLFWALFDALTNSEANIQDAVITNGYFLMDAIIGSKEEIGMYTIVITGLKQLEKKYPDQVKYHELAFDSTFFDI